MGLFKKKDKTFAEDTVADDAVQDNFTEPVVDEGKPCPIKYAHPEHPWFESNAGGGTYQWGGGVPELDQAILDAAVEYDCKGVEPKHAKE